MVAEVDVFDAQTEAFEETETRAIEKAGHDPVNSAEVAEYEADLFAGEDDGKPFGLLGTGEVVKPGKRLFQDFAVKEEECSQRLVLGRGGNVSFDGQVGEELSGLYFAQLFGMPFAMEDDVFSYPSDVGFFGSKAVMFTSANDSHLV